MGVATVLNRVWAMTPCAQESPRGLLNFAWPDVQTLLQVAIPALTLTESANTFVRMAVFGMGTETSPTSFICCICCMAPTVDSAKAMLPDVPSIMSRIDLDCWKANSPMVVMVA